MFKKIYSVSLNFLLKAAFQHTYHLSLLIQSCTYLLSCSHSQVKQNQIKTKKYLRLGQKLFPGHFQSLLNSKFVHCYEWPIQKRNLIEIFNKSFEKIVENFKRYVVLFVRKETKFVWSNVLMLIYVTVSFLLCFLKFFPCVSLFSRDLRKKVKTRTCTHCKLGCIYTPLLILLFRDWIRFLVHQIRCGHLS